MYMCIYVYIRIYIYIIYNIDDFSWVDRLPLIMLSLHVAQRDDGQLSPAEMVYGSSLTLPADLITPSERI